MTRRVLLATLGTAALLATFGLAGPAGAAGQSLGFNNARQMVATGPDTFAIVWVEDGRVVVGERRYGAASFTAETTVASGPRATQPAIARRGDRLVVAWVDGGRIKVRVRDGDRWLAVRTLGEGAAPSLAASRDAFGLVWHREGDGGAVLFSRLGASGAWSPPLRLASGRGDTVSFASLAGAGNRFAAVWKRGGDGAGWAVETARSDDGGRHWGRTRTVGAGGDPAICLAGGNEVWVAYQTTGRIVVLRSGDGGRTFSRADVGEGWFAHLACARDGATIAWERTAYPPRYPDSSVKSFGLARVDSGLRVTAEPAPAAANVAAPTILAAGARRVYAWIDVGSSSSPLAGTLHVVSPG